MSLFSHDVFLIRNEMSLNIKARTEINVTKTIFFKRTTMLFDIL